MNRIGLISIFAFSLISFDRSALAGQAGYDEKAVADFYRGKTVTILVGHSAGGGFDTYARTIARHLSKHIPGNPNILVTNMPGAGTMISLNHMYNSGARDGTLINSFDGGLVPSQIYGSKSVQFDLTKLSYLGAPDSFKYITVVTKKSGITKMEDVLGPKGKQMIIGAVPNTGIEHASMLLREVLGGNVKMVSGYKGTAEIRMAMKAGEVESVITGWETLQVTNMKDFESGEWLILSQWLDEPLPDLPVKNVPLIHQFARNEEERQLLRAGIIKPNQFSRPYALPPGVPLDRVQALEAAFQKTLRDPELLAEAAKSKLTISPISGERIRSMIVEGLSLPEKIKERLRPIIAPRN